jgi:hypothetical protein
MGVTEAVKRRQRDCRLCESLRNHDLWTPTLYLEWEGNTDDAAMAWHGGSTGVSGSRACNQRSARNLGDPTVSERNSAG